MINKSSFYQSLSWNPLLGLQLLIT